MVGLKPFVESLRSVWRFILVRLAYLIIAYFITITIIFFLPRLVPGNPIASQAQAIIQRLAMGALQPEAIASAWKYLVRMYGLGRPLHEQYIKFILNLFSGNFGYSMVYYPKTASELIMQAVPYSLILLVPSTLIAWIIGNTLGAFATYRGGKLESALTTFAVIMAQVPPYWLAFLFVYLFVANLKIFPPGEAWSPGLKPSLTPEFILDFLWHYTLPFTTIVVTSIFGWYLGMRFICVSELGADYIAYSESLGVKDKTLFRYVYRNSLLPQVTGLAISFGTALAGQTIVENIFRWPGSGFVLSRAIGSLDYPVIQGTFAVLTLTLFTANFLVDFIYALIDPRIRLGGGG
jgi:peptide/nickel transport system permease protein